MKKLISILILILMILSMTGNFVYAEPQYVEAEREIHVLGGSATGKVVIKDGVTMIALDEIGFYLSTGAGTKKGNPALFGQKHEIAIEQGTATAFVDDEKVIMPQASFVKNGRLYVPLTFVVESLGYLVYWREKTQTIYIQSPEYYAEALVILQKSLESVEEKSYVTTSYINHTNLNSAQPERYFIESKGVMSTDMKNNVAQDAEQSTVYNGYYDSFNKKPVQTYVSTDPVDSWQTFKYITENGIYYQTDTDSYNKEPVPPENISTIDMATKSVFTDPELFLYSATIDTNRDSSISINAETDIGILLKVGFDIFMPSETDSLQWTETYQTIKYDPVTYLPKNLKLSLYANYQHEQEDYGTVHLEYMHDYSFDFNTPVEITLPDSVK